MSVQQILLGVGGAAPAPSFLHTGRLTNDGESGYGEFGYSDGNDWSDGTPGAYTNLSGTNVVTFWWTDVENATRMGFGGTDLNGTGNIQVRKDGGSYQTFTRLSAGFYSCAGNPFAFNNSGFCNELYEVIAV